MPPPQSVGAAARRRVSVYLFVAVFQAAFFAFRALKGCLNVVYTGLFVVLGLRLRGLRFRFLGADSFSAKGVLFWA